MTASTANIQIDNTTQATFNAWIAAVHNLLIAAGLVQTTDTGQLAVTSGTVTMPATSTFAGYTVYRFNDSLQSTAPVFIRIDWGTGNSAGRIGFKVTVGTATNGAGVIGGLNVSFLGSASGSYINDTIARPCYASSDGSYLTLALAPQYTQIAFLLVLDRTRNADGSANGDGLYVRQNNSNNSTQATEQVFSYYLNTKSAQVSSTQLAARSPVALWTSLADGTDIYTAPIQVYAPRGEAPCSALLYAVAADIGFATTFSVTHLGAAHTFISMGAAVSGGDGFNSPAMCLRYE